MSNALKFTPGGGRIAITAARAEDGIWITVADTGISIAPAQIPIALAPFGQIESSQAGAMKALASDYRSPSA
ncbi:MAG TPA: ATP-binding protein [Stellaceae bacterium]|nr:ATP-binding protein [Stellaceae bacterium]